MPYKFTKDFFDSLFFFNDYKALIEKLLSENKTTGEDQSISLVEYTKLNFQRMKRIEKTFQEIYEIKQAAENISNVQNWVLISEAWCGDAANCVPVIYRISELSEKINLRIALRDENPELMNEYLTNGKKSIPILIMLDEGFQEIGKWGARPVELQNFVLNSKQKEGFDLDQLKKDIQMWYFNDKTVSIQKEISKIII